MKKVTIDASGLSYHDLNQLIKNAAKGGADDIEVANLSGQRYIGSGIKKEVALKLHGTPGSDLAAFNYGPRIEVFGCGQEAVGNTMNSGDITIHGHCNDVLGISMRGGSIFVRDYAGYRVGLHMKEYQDIVPTIVIGGPVGHFLGEYMAGGVILVLGLNSRNGGSPIAGNFIGTGMHGGVIYLRGEVQPGQLGKEVSVTPMEEADRQTVRQLVSQYCQRFGDNETEILAAEFTKLKPISSRPYGQLYVS